MSGTVPARVETIPAYGWSAEGKSAAEISDDILQTRFRLDADLRTLRARFVPRRFLPAAAIGAGLAALTFVIRRIRRRTR
jgi:hypothetical protein